jgi:hypothetical protein
MGLGTPPGETILTVVSTAVALILSAFIWARLLGLL